nr:hypothetical protein [Kibdelosporangium sp. MJ126-NF4]CEL23126.1 hypothetical protein [Kibdelosporangium sp. MJ126-NF4]CTQ90263.1 hypothetical protein [Kibdelosporangium sp. MJ126-NF4]
MVDSLNPLFQAQTPRIGGHTLTTVVDADTGQLRAMGSVLSTTEDAAEHLGDTCRTADGTITHAWTGQAADRARETLHRHRLSAYDLATHLNRVAATIARFADDIDRVTARMNEARDLARAAGYRVTRDMIQFPLPIADPAASGPSGVITALVAAARQEETAAHVRLRAELAEQKSFLESLPTPLRGLGLTQGMFMASTGTAAYMDSAVDHARTIVAASAIAENTTGGLRQSAYQQLFRTAPWAAVDQAVAGVRKPLDYGAVNWANLPADPEKTRYAKAFLKPLTVSGGVLGGAGIGLQVLQGTPPEKAIVAGGASWAAGAVASGLTEAALLTIGVGAGPIGWATLAVGFVASAGVGYVIDQAWK